MKYKKTDFGVIAFTEKRVPLTRQQRNAFVLLNGKCDTEDLLKETSGLSFSRADIEHLLNLGMIVPVEESAPLSTHPSSKSAPFKESSFQTHSVFSPSTLEYLAQEAAQQKEADEKSQALEDLYNFPENGHLDKLGTKPGLSGFFGKTRSEQPPKTQPTPTPQKESFVVQKPPAHPSRTQMLQANAQRYTSAYPVAVALTASLGLRGLKLNLAVEKASGYEELVGLLPKIREAVGETKIIPLEQILLG